jgi:hypothetical protein
MGFLLHLLIINPKGSKKCPKTLMIVCPAGPGPGGGGISLLLDEKLPHHLCVGIQRVEEISRTDIDE